MSSPQQDLIGMARSIGFRVPFWIQGGGGNVSLKANSELWIKASGTRIDQMTVEKGIAVVDLFKFQKGFASLLTEPDGDERESRYSHLLTDCQMSTIPGQRPSMETGFHALLPGQRIYHFHSLASLAMAQLSYRAEVTDLVQDCNLTVDFISLARPGVNLTAAVIENNQADIYLLESHGVILQGKDEKTLELWQDIETRFLKSVTESPMSALNKFAQTSVTEAMKNLGGKIQFIWKNYFPDAAVFEKDILRTFGGPQNEVKLSIHTWEEIQRRGDLKVAGWFEVALASYLLGKLIPTLPELPEIFAESLVVLPTEKFRQVQS